LKPTQSYPRKQVAAIDKELSKVFQVKGKSDKSGTQGKKKANGAKARPEL
jgi:hypothetical protein